MASRPGCPETLDDVDVFAPETIENWYPTYSLLQREAPVYPVPGTNTYFVTRYDDISHVLRRTDVFRRGAGTSRPLLKDEQARRLYEAEGWPKVLPLGMDPPVHRRYRDLVDHFFSVQGAELQRPVIERIVHELIDDWIDDGRAEFMAAFATPLPVRVITTMMGLPVEDIPQLKEWSEAWVSPFSGQLTPEEERVAARKMVDFQHYLKGHIDHRRANPGGADVVSHLVHTPLKHPDGDRPLTDGEIINMVDHLYIGGNETTTFALTSGMWLLIQHPDLQRRLRAEPRKIRAFVDEVLRLESPTQGMDRHTAEDTELGGVPIPKGAHVHIRYAAANRDPDQYACPAEMDVDRPNGYRHLAFSLGESHCPGAGLSRLEQIVAWEALLDRIDNLAFVGDADDFVHHTNLTLRAFTGLELTFDRRSGDR